MVFLLVLVLDRERSLIGESDYRKILLVAMTNMLPYESFSVVPD